MAGVTYSRIIPVYSRQEARRGLAWTSPRQAWGNVEACGTPARPVTQRQRSEMMDVR